MFQPLKGQDASGMLRSIVIKKVLSHLHTHTSQSTHLWVLLQQLHTLEHSWFFRQDMASDV